MGEGKGGGGQRRPSITLIPTFPHQGGRRLRVVSPIAKRVFVWKRAVCTISDVDDEKATNY